MSKARAQYSLSREYQSIYIDLLSADMLKSIVGISAKELLNRRRDAMRIGVGECLFAVSYSLDPIVGVEK